MSPAAAAAIEACRQYDHWAREVARLTREITATKCPGEAEGDLYQSCFTALKYEEAGLGSYAAEGGYGPGRRFRLDEIGTRVADCPDCTRLVSLIRERREARQRLGVAKRAVRRVGRGARAEATP